MNEDSHLQSLDLAALITVVGGDEAASQAYARAIARANAQGVELPRIPGQRWSPATVSEPFNGYRGGGGTTDYPGMGRTIPINVFR